MSLLIEQLTQEVEKTAEVNKTAEEVQFEKLAQEVNTLDQSRTLIAVGEEMYKIANDLGNENLATLAVDTYQLGERMGSCLAKTASNSGAAIEEAFEIAQDLNKVASVYAEIADDVKDEEFNKLASAIIEISNEMTDEANEALEEAGEVEKEAAEGEKGRLNKAKGWVSEKAKAGYHGMGRAFRAKDMQAFLAEHKHVFAGGPESKGVKALLTTGAGLKTLVRPAIAYGGAAAALAAAGYGAKKLHDKK